MEATVLKDGKQLRCGYTTGSCAAAAAKAAAWMLMTGERRESIQLTTPKGVILDLPVQDIRIGTDQVSCAIRKDSGDDPDATNGTLIYATVSRNAAADILIDGGQGIGRVTKPGLDQPVSAAAINSVPREMIKRNLEEIRTLFDMKDGFSVIISAPDGETLAKKTFNSRLGIIGGISILGTSGIVEPMSDQALIETIRLELRQRRLTTSNVILTPGNYGLDFIHNQFGLNQEIPVTVSNFIGDALSTCQQLEFKKVLLIGHIGKLVKLAGGMMNTHSRYGDCRMEIIAAHAAASGLGMEQINELLDCVTCDEAIRILKENDCFEAAIGRIGLRIQDQLHRHIGDSAEIGVMIFSNLYGILYESDNARELLSGSMEE